MERDPIRHIQEGKEHQPLPEIALALGRNGAPEAVHVGTQGLDLGDVALNGEGELRRVEANPQWGRRR